MSAPPLESEHTHGPLIPLALAALGVVYGDIGTSPLYALRECFVGEHSLPISVPNVLGVLSLVFWSLTMVVSIKYLLFLMRADNDGEGGILALLALLGSRAANGNARRNGLLLVGLFGAALLYGDGVITPAISVLSAVEGLQVATAAFEPFILPISATILIGLFLVQRNGTAGIGAVFGPLMLLWFATIAWLGLHAILSQHPQQASVLSALNPMYAVEFFTRNGIKGLLTLGAVVLCVTGSEALYADMGHFGPRPIRLAWYGVAFPALLLNYFGQGALLLAEGEKIANPFYQLAPTWGLYPLVVLSTIATIIASQALISGAFSLTQQAVQLGYAPRFKIVHTSGTAVGQIYMPEINWALMVTCVILVMGFKSSSNLAGAYGIAVTGTMTVTSLLFYVLTRERWQWSVPKAGAVIAAFLLFDLSFLTANLPKVLDGGWFPLVVGLAVFSVLTTWKRGRGELAQRLAEGSLPIDLFLQDVAVQQPHRVEGTAIVMTSNPQGVPPVLLHHLKHNRTLHKRVVLLSIVSEKRPEVPADQRVAVTDLGQGFYRVVARFGFIETPRMTQILTACQTHGLTFDLMSTTFVLGRETLLPSGRSPMARWRKRLYGFLARNAPSASNYFEIPPNRVIELGVQIEL
ncbi:MAG TPA: potassium transporter Kup [Candidatus Binatia bacterium]|nr:potassium transporter Kup [Candidatus Binatia bacterium]